MKWCSTLLLVLTLSGCDPNVVIGRLGDSAVEGGADDDLPEVTWLSGAHSGNNLSEYQAFASWRGRPLDFAHVFPDRTQGWEDLMMPNWPVDMFGPFEGKLMLSLPLYPPGFGNNQDCASGAYDSQWRKLGEFLVAKKRGDSIVRLGWGPYDLEHAWHADPDPASWIGCFRRVVTAIRQTAPLVEIDWSFDAAGVPGVADRDPYTTYPGDAYVDYVGLELFDRYPPTKTKAEWEAKCNAPTGLCSLIRFARARGKRVGIAEWGVVSCGESAGGDNPFFVRRVLATFAANRDILAYEAYFEDSGGVCSQIVNGQSNPESAVLYRTVYSRR